MSEVKKGKSLDELNKAVKVAKIEHSGEKMILPEGMDLDDAIDLLRRRKAYLQEEVIVRETVPVFPWDGAHALSRLLTKKYGWAPAVPIPGFFGDKPPEMKSIEIAFGVVEQVPWGRFELPGISGFIQTDAKSEDGQLLFEIIAKVKRDDERVVRELFAELREYAVANSIYRGKALSIQFFNTDGEKLDIPVVKFMDTNVDETKLVYSQDVTNAIETNLFTPITRLDDCKLNGVPTKRGVLLGGVYGTGKTLAAKVAAKLAVQVGVTFLYTKAANELVHAITFGRLYEKPAVVIFCEDIDRVTDGTRSAAMDDILNTIDGIDSKNSNVIVVLTTNNMEGINQAMLRPGRLDAVINVTPPDAEAVQRLLRVYGGDAIAANEDLTRAGEVMAGNIPAVIAEVVQRAKLAQLRRTPRGERVTGLTGDALAEAATTMAAQLDLLKPKDKNDTPTIDGILRSLTQGVVGAETKNLVKGTKSDTKALRDRLGV